MDDGYEPLVWITFLDPEQSPLSRSLPAVGCDRRRQRKKPVEYSKPDQPVRLLPPATLASLSLRRRLVYRVASFRLCDVASTRAPRAQLICQRMQLIAL